jgi:sugar fermentation stimulation protein A
MRFSSPLLEGVLIRRYKRFLADVELADGRHVTAHTPNTGSMKGCCSPGSRVWLRDSGNPSRKYPLSWELVEDERGTLVGINTALANDLVAEGIACGTIAELQAYGRMRREVRYGAENSRIDLLLEEGDSRCYVEVKNVTLLDGETALFPDAVTLRGAKHLRELTEMARQGHRAVIFFCVQRGDAVSMSPADAIDPAYGQALRSALDSRVEALAYRAAVSPEGIALRLSIPLRVDRQQGA